MAKRFISSELFDDPWFMELSRDSKLGYIYMITKCDHAGIIEPNRRLMQISTGCHDLLAVFRDLDSRLIQIPGTLKFFLPKFIDFQYPKGLLMTVKAHESAKDLLEYHGLWNQEIFKKCKVLGNPYLRVKNKSMNKSKDKDKNKSKNKSFEIFWKLYDKLIDEPGALEVWCTLSEDDRTKILARVGAYVESTPKKNYRMNAKNWLSDNRWTDEIISPSNDYDDKFPDKPNDFFDNHTTDTPLLNKARQYWRKNGWTKVTIPVEHGPDIKKWVHKDDQSKTA